MPLPDDPAVVQSAGGEVTWLKPKGPQHVVSEYWIFVWLGPNAFTTQQELFERVRAWGHALGAVALVWRRYDSDRRAVQDFRDDYLFGPVLIPLAVWNDHIQLLEQVLVDTESFFWFSNRLLSHVALTINFFFKKALKKSIPKGGKIKSHSTLVGSPILREVPPELQELAKRLEKEVASFRNERVEHDIDFWRRNAIETVEMKGMSAVPEAALHLEWSDRPLSDIWISLHDYATEVAKFIGSAI